MLAHFLSYMHSMNAESDGIANADETSAEIEVTPEMIEAGVGMLCAYDERFVSMEEAVTAIFKAMVEAVKSTAFPCKH
jgi:hypothetical protein